MLDGLKRALPRVSTHTFIFGNKEPPVIMETSRTINYLKDFGVMRCCSAAVAFVRAITAPLRDDELTCMQLLASFIATAFYNILFSPLKKC